MGVLAIRFCISCRKRVGCVREENIKEFCFLCKTGNDCIIRKRFGHFKKTDDTSAVCPKCQEKEGLNLKREVRNGETNRREKQNHR